MDSTLSVSCHDEPWSAHSLRCLSPHLLRDPEESETRLYRLPYTEGLHGSSVGGFPSAQFLRTLQKAVKKRIFPDPVCTYIFSPPHAVSGEISDFDSTCSLRIAQMRSTLPFAWPGRTGDPGEAPFRWRRPSGPRCRQGWRRGDLRPPPLPAPVYREETKRNHREYRKRHLESTRIHLNDSRKVHMYCFH